MILRCYTPSTRKYQFYGGKGISVCPEWRASFQSFFDWATANGFDPKLELDRIDGTLDYFPENCQWITKEENLRKRIFTKAATDNARKSLGFVDRAYRMECIKKACCKAVRCVETGVVYESAAEASRALGKANDRVQQVLDGRHKTSCGYHWEYV